MAFFDDSSRMAASPNAAANEINKFNAAIAHEENKINNLYSTIGKAYVENYEGDPASAVKPMVEAIFESRRIISEARNQIEFIKNTPRCAVCGMPVDQNSAFCSNCGSPAPKLEGVICSKCGALLDKSSKFCTVCGNAVVNASAAPTPEKKLCANCKNPLEEGSAFCTVCGYSATPAPQEPEAPANEEPQASAAGFEAPKVVPVPVPEVPVDAPSVEMPFSEETSAEAVEDTVPEEVASEETAPEETVPEEPAEAAIGAAESLSEPDFIPSDDFMNEPTRIAGDFSFVAPTPEPETVMPEPAQEPEISGPRCANCGCALEDGMMFCTECGMPIGASPVPAPIDEYKAPEPEAVMPEPVQEPEISGPRCASCGCLLEDGMMFCTECGTPVAREEIKPEPVSEFDPDETIAMSSAYVPKNTAPEGIICASCNAVLPEGTLFCTNCGTPTAKREAPMGKTCPNCGTALDDDMIFCTNCGTRV